MKPALGATYLGDGRTRFEVWGPRRDRVAIHLIAPHRDLLPLEPTERGYHVGVHEDVPPGARYFVRLGEDRPDPASRSQPEGVHGPSEVVDLTYPWTDDRWRPHALRDLVIYELHAGAFTPEGTFDAAIERLADLAELGVTAVEVMPVAQAPGERNWGYDGVQIFAVQASLGGPRAFQRFVDAAHARGLSVVLDVVYNHLGPEGNYLGEYGPYFTDRTKTPWGPAVNFDGPESDEVRRFFIENALHWVRDFHVDALRLDAVHAIVDASPRPFLRELAETIDGRALLIAESDANDARLIRSAELGGMGLDAVWADDLHHAIHALLTGEDHRYYEGFGGLDLLARAYRNGWAYTGQYSPSRRRRHGSPTDGIPPERFVVCSQNHDQVGNRPFGERLEHLAGFEAAKLAASLVLLSPFTPLIFMGEEDAEPNPFLYFVDHGDAALVEAVRKGRREEHAVHEAPDPQARETFQGSKLTRPHDGRHRAMRELYRELLRHRATLPGTRDQDVIPLE